MTKIVEAVRPTAAQRIDAEQRAITSVEREIVDLQRQRAAKLLDSDGVDDIAALDRTIAKRREAARILTDRIEALHAEVRRQAQVSADRDRADQIAVTEKNLAARDATAIKLETAIKDMGRLYFELIDQNLIIARQWGMSNNARRVGALGESIISRMVSHALFAVGRPIRGVARLPGPGTLGLGIAGDSSASTLAEQITGASRDLLEMVRAVPTDEAA